MRSAIGWVPIWVALACLACSEETAPAGEGATSQAPQAQAGTPATAGSGVAAPDPRDAGAASPSASAGAKANASGAPAPQPMAAGSAAPAAGAPAAGNGGSGVGGAGSGAIAGSSGSSGSGGQPGGAAIPTEKFSFFVTSLGGMRELSKNEQGFGGDLRYGETTGLAGADKICRELAEKSMPGAGAKGWRAFLSTAKGGAGDGPIHAKDRIGTGPWYDRRGRVVAMDLNALLQPRPAGADPAIANDLPNERGEPNQTDTVDGMDDNHDVVTGTNAQGMWDGTMTCNDWTSHETPMMPAMPQAGGPGGMGRPFPGGGAFPTNGPRVGHSWPAQQSGVSWMTAHVAHGCSPSVSLVQNGPGVAGTGIGNAGGYGAIYCFALMP